MVHRVQLQCNVDELGGKYTEAEPRCTCPPYESTLQSSQRWFTLCNFSQVHLGQVEVQLGFASLDFNLASMDLTGVCGGSPRATPLKFNFGQVEVQLGFASLNFNLTKIELETKSVKFNTNYR